MIHLLNIVISIPQGIMFNSLFTLQIEPEDLLEICLRYGERHGANTRNLD